MPAEVALRSPAKINWSLEVLGRREDGYHEVRTILQTIALSDRLTVTAADELTIEIANADDLAAQPMETNLAYRAGAMLQEKCGVRTGAHIHIEKRIPVGAGLGGGSSNAATALRALTSLWRLTLAKNELAELAGPLGSDVPFFLSGGTALGTGRGDEITPLTDVQQTRLLLAWPDLAEQDKTARMYAALEPEHYSDGRATDALADRLGHAAAIVDESIRNPFEHVLRDVHPAGSQGLADAHAFGQPHLAGSGPAFFFLLPPNAPTAPTIHGLQKLGLHTIETHTITSSEALEPA